MSTENQNEKLQTLIYRLGVLINLLARQNTIVEAECRRKNGILFKKTNGIPSGGHRDFDRIFLKSLRIRFEDFSEV